MRSIGSALIVAAAFVLAAPSCVTTRAVPPVAALRPNLPPPDARLADTNFCGRGDAKAGEDPRVSARRKELARRCEAGRVASWNSFYGNLRRGLR